MFSKLRSALVGLLVIAASTVAVTVSNSPVSAMGTVAPRAVTSSPSIGAQNVPTWSNTNMIAVATGFNSSCAIQGSSSTSTSGTLFCWGKAGTLGTGATSDSNVAVAVTAANGFTNTAVTAVAIGDEHACAVEAGQLWCWGSAYFTGEYGTIGAGSTTARTPVLVSANGDFHNAGTSGDTVTAVTASFARTCAIEGGQSFCWGSNNSLQLGLGSNQNNPIRVPNRVVDTASPEFQAATATKISSGFFHTCAIASTSVHCWGSNYSFQLGNSTPTGAVPVKVSQGEFATANTNITAVDADWDHSCAVQGGKVLCWGENGDGQLGTGNTTTASTPTAVSVSGTFANAGSVTAIGAGEGHSCAVDNGKLFCWGKNTSRQLGDGTSTSSNTPVLVATSDEPGFNNTAVTAVSGGDYHTCAIEAMVVYCWGSNSNSQLGDGSFYASFKPKKVFVLSAPGTATIDSIMPSNGSLSVSIRQPSDGGSIITGYDYTTNNGNTFTNVARPSGSNGFYYSINIPNLTNGTQYSVKVRAVNAIGAGDWSLATNATPSSGSGGGGGGGSCTGGATISPSSTTGYGTVGNSMSLSGPTPAGYTVAPTFSISGVPLPDGLTLNAQTGAVTGTPTASSYASVIINVASGAQSCQYNIMFSISSSGGGGGIGGGTPACTTGVPSIGGTNPTLDPSFGTGGAIAFATTGTDNVLQGGVATSDGNLVIAESVEVSGNPVIKFRKYSPAGTLVSSFGTSGVLTIDKSSGAPFESADDVAELSDGSLIAIYTVRSFGMSSSTQSYLLKLTSNGAVDTSFGTNGYATITAPSNANIRSLKVLSNDSMIVLVNSYSQMVMSNQLVKFTSAGAADSAFGTSGTVTLSGNEYDFTVNSADSIFVGGSTGGSSSSATVKKYTSAGVLDTTWATSGVLSIAGVGNQGDGHSVMAVATDASNNIYVAVRASAMGSMASTSKLFRLLADGTNDSSFGSGTLLSSGSSPYVADILVLADGNVVLNSMNSGMTPAAGVSLVSSTGVLDSSHATNTALLQFGNCPISETQIVQLTTGEVMAFGSTYVMGSSSGDSTGSLWKLNFSGVTGGGSNVDTPSTPATPAADTPSTPATTATVPTLVTSANAAALVRAPGAQSIIVNGEEVVIESNTVNIPAARTPETQRTPAQVASIQQAGAALLQQFLASLPAGATSNVAVVNTATGAVMQNLVFDANGNSVNVPVEDIVFLDGPQLSLMIGSDNANITSDGKYQVGAGGIVGVTGSGLGAGANGEIIAMSTPTLLANFQTTAAGNFNKSATLPSSIGVGDHTLVVATGTTYAMMGIRVVPAALPTTGSSTENVVIIALFTLVFGALFFRGRRVSLN